MNVDDLATLRRSDARTVRRALREKQRRDEAGEELEAIKREAVREAQAHGLSHIRKVHPTTGQKITVYRTRQGPPFEETHINELVPVLGEALSERLFPTTTRRSADWGAVQEFLAADHPAGSREASAARAVASVVDNRTSWGMKISDPTPRGCLECDAEVPESEPLRLCRQHRSWYKISYLMMKLAKGDGEVELRKFNDKRRTRYRARFLTKAGAAAWREREDSRATGPREHKEEAQ